MSGLDYGRGPEYRSVAVRSFARCADDRSKAAVRYIAARSSRSRRTEPRDQAGYHRVRSHRAEQLWLCAQHTRTGQAAPLNATAAARSLSILPWSSAATTGPPPAQPAPAGRPGPGHTTGVGQQQGVRAWRRSRFRRQAPGSSGGALHSACERCLRLRTDKSSDKAYPPPQRLFA